jgi:hypothetical protein
MKSAQVQLEHTKSEAAAGRTQKLRPLETTVSSRPFALNDFAPSALRLSTAFMPSRAFAPPAQGELSVSQPGDQYEQEADLVAEQVLQMNVPSEPSGDSGRNFLCSSSPLLYAWFETLSTSGSPPGANATLTAPASRP